MQVTGIAGAGTRSRMFALAKIAWLILVEISIWGPKFMTNSNSFAMRAALASTTASLALGLALISAPAAAQTTAAAAAEDTGTIVVTGSRIARKDLESPAPLTIVSGEEFKLRNAVNVENVINSLPQVTPSTTAFSNNPGGGVALLNLRNLGSTRTLVLVNGRRYMFFDATQRVDLNTIPSFLIDNVEVVTGGASAVYGSDAIAGVVNFRLRNLQGIEVGSSQSLTEKGDGHRFDVNLAMGGEFADGKGRITAYGSYYKRDSITAGLRSFSERVAQDNGAAGLTFNGGSPTTPAGRFLVPATSAVPAGPMGSGLGAVTLPRGVGAFGTADGATFTNGASTARPFSNATDLFNFNPDNYLMVPQERWLVGAYGEYDVTEGLTAYMETSFVNNRVQTRLAPTPVTGNFNVNLATVSPFLSAADNALFQQVDANETAINAARTARGLAPLFTGAAAPANAAGTIQLTVNRRIQDVVARQNFDERSAYRVLTGVKGDIGSTGLTYDAYYMYSRTRNSNIQGGNVSRRAFQAGLDGTGTAIDIFGPNTLTPAMANAITISAQNTTISELQVAQGSIAGNIFNLGWGGQDVAIAAGVEWRQMAAEFIPDTALSSGDVIGFNAGNPTKGKYSAKEVFGEIRIPIAADQPFISRLELTGAGRYSDYSLDAVGGVWTYAAGLEYAPVPDITFRGQYSRAVRAPNVQELFGGLQTGFPGATDPCTTPAALAAGGLRNTCLATGVPAANLGLGVPSQLQPAVQIQSQSGGNPNLTAERADTYTFGAVLRPSFIPRLSIAADYYNIKINNTIATAGGGIGGILNFCYNVYQDPNNGFCQLIRRNPATGSIDGSAVTGGNAVVFTGAANLSASKVSGIDLVVDYNVPLNFGLVGEESRLYFSFNGSWTESNQFTPVLGQPTVVECAGQFGQLNCGTPTPKYKTVTRLTWMDGALTSSINWRYISAVTDDNPAIVRAVERIGAYSLFDLAFSFDVNDNFTVTAGVNNLLNKNPPVLGANAEQSNTYPGQYDVLGRDYFISGRLRF